MTCVLTWVVWYVEKFRITPAGARVCIVKELKVHEKFQFRIFHIHAMREIYTFVKDFLHYICNIYQCKLPRWVF
jgi:hypothetical protein